MNKKFLFFVVTALIMSMLFMTGCGKNASVKGDLKNLDRKVTDILSTFQTDAQKINANLSKAEQYKKFEELSKNAQKEIKAIDVKTEEVKKLYKVLLAGFDESTESISTMAEAAEKNNDQALFNKAMSQSKDSAKTLNDFYKKSKALAKKEGVTLKMKKFE